MSSLVIGGTYSARIHGIAGPWTVHGTVTIWDVQHHDNGLTTVTVQLSDHPDPRCPGHSTYATATVSALPDGARALVDLVTPEPGPSRIGLGYRLLAQHPAEDAALHLAAADHVLAEWEPVPADDSPLGSSALPALARAAHRATEHTTGRRDAEAERDQLIRRLDAGGVPRDVLAHTIGRNISRIGQLCRTSPTGRTNCTTVDA
ncbi:MULTISPECIES: hypothetical protein [Streptomycetaceae]|uniref:hypothetical protein n=1 Tax=Streptomycetaceae TaxID=2062 RepID=UPI00093FA4A5|nr:hypothetical protein [Streptomyces sp. CB02056]OKI08813.1 hypothetical protein AMK13_10480 [Streptomyces sp. CB02056]